MVPGLRISVEAGDKSEIKGIEGNINLKLVAWVSPEFSTVKSTRV